MCVLYVRRRVDLYDRKLPSALADREHEVRV